ncbi:hypothetical protein SEVIR_5G042516v4 [Setaria viridis]
MTRDGGAALPGALEGGERSVLCGADAEGHLRQLRGRRAHRRRHQRGVAPPAGPGQQHRPQQRLQVADAWATAVSPCHGHTLDKQIESTTCPKRHIFMMEVVFFFSIYS